MSNIKWGWGKKVRNQSRGGISFCDQTEMAYNYSDLVKQYEWRGNQLTWTGFMVGYDVVDVPNQNVRPFQYKKEGVPPPNIRPPQPEIIAMSTQETLQTLKSTVWSS